MGMATADEVIKLFNECDEDNDGKLSKEEFVTIMGRLNSGFSSEENLQIMEAVDTNGDGYIQVEELINWIFDRSAAPESNAITISIPREAEFAVPVTLHLYDVTGNEVISKVNRILAPLGTGVFHGAVEIYGQEWSFGYCDEGTGVFSCPPKGCEMHKYRMPVPMGEAKMSEAEVDELLDIMSGEWGGASYDLLRRNCCSFSDDFCRRLGVGAIPYWVLNLAAAGATVHDGFKKAQSESERAAIITAAKANEIDEKYQISSKTQALANDVVGKASELDEKYGVSKNIDAKWKELDGKHDLTGKAAKATGTCAAAATATGAAIAGKAGALLGALSAPKKQ